MSWDTTLRTHVLSELVTKVAFLPVCAGCIAFGFLHGLREPVI